MSLLFDGFIDLDSEQFQRFLISTDTQFRFDPEKPIGFSFDRAHIRTDDDVDIDNSEIYSNPSELDYLVCHKYPLLQQKQNSQGQDITVILGEVTAKTLCKAAVKFTAEFQLHLADHITNEHIRNEAINLFNNYIFQPGQQGQDEEYIEEWIASESEGRIGPNDYKVVVAHIADVLTRIEFDRSQLDLLLKMYSMPRDTETAFYPPPFNGDRQMSLDDYFNQAGITLGEPRRDIDFKDEGDAVTNKQSIDVDSSSGQDQDNAVQDAVDDLVRDAVPIDACTPDKLDTHKNLILRMPSYPEFKTVWEKKRIKIGCSRITIRLPALYVKETQKLYYTYYSHPKNLYQTAINICTKCAERGAISGAVVGLITWNFAAGVAEFQRVFYKCINEETQKCITAGILEVNETKGWKRKASF